MSKPVKVPKPRTPTVWLTRDSDATGVVSSEVRVWLDQPGRYRDELGVYWTCEAAEALLGVYPLGQAAFDFRTVPDDDRQLVRNGK